MRYEAPESLEAAVRLLSSETGLAKILAGGTDLLVQLKTDLVEPDLIVDIKGIEDVRTISGDGVSGYRIGAAVTGAEMEEHATLKNDWPGVVEGANLIGSTQIQGRATMGGNLCNGSPAADSVPGLIAAGASATVAGPNGTREVAVKDVMVGPRQLSIAKDEFVVAFQLPARKPHSADAYLRFIPRTEMDIAVVGAGVNIETDGSGKITAAAVALAAVAPTPLLVEAAGQALVGTSLETAALDALDGACQAACNPIDDKRGTIAYRTKVSGVIARRSAEIAYQRARAK